MTQKPLKEPCKQCPWRRNSAPGYLGEASYDPVDFYAPHIFGNARLPCHMRVNWEQEIDDQEFPGVPTCKGYAIFCANNIRLPRNRQDAEEAKGVKQDHDSVFSNLAEFEEHHGE